MDILIPELTYAHAEVQLQKEAITGETRKHKEYVKKCEELRSRLVRDIRDAFSSCGIKQKLPAFSKHRQKIDLIQDLNDLATLCRNCKDVFTNIYFNFKLSEQAAIHSKQLSLEVARIDLLHETNTSDEVEKRNKIYFDMFNQMAAICRCGRNAFWDQPERRKLYRSIK